MSRHFFLIAILCLAPSIAAAQQRLDVVDQQSSLTVRSKLPVPVAVMIAPVNRSQSASTFVVVDASGSANVKKPGSGSYALSKMEPVSWTIASTQEPRCVANLSAQQVKASIANLRATLDRLSAQRDVETEQLAAIATQITATELDQEEDVRNFQRYNAFNMEVRRQYFRDNPYGQAYAEQDFNQDIEDTFNAFASLNRMFAAGDDSKRTAIYNEVKYLEPLAQGADGALTMLREEFARSAEQAKTGSGFMNMLVEKLESNKPTFATDIAVSGAAKRTCPKAAGIEDYVEVTARSQDPRLAIALGEVSFDKGGSQRTVFRKLKGSDRWIAPIYWPADASKSEVKLRAGNKWQKVASLQPGRPSMTETRKQAEKNIENVKKRYKTLKFRAEGGDGVKTIIVP
jgi:hypothetical protein